MAPTLRQFRAKGSAGRVAGRAAGLAGARGRRPAPPRARRTRRRRRRRGAGGRRRRPRGRRRWPSAPASGGPGPRRWSPRRSGWRRLWTTDGAPDALALPTALAVGRQGRLYVVDAGNDRLQVFDGDGRFLTRWGEHGHGRRPVPLPAARPLRGRRRLPRRTPAGRWRSTSRSASTSPTTATAASRPSTPTGGCWRAGAARAAGRASSCCRRASPSDGRGEVYVERHREPPRPGLRRRRPLPAPVGPAGRGGRGAALAGRAGGGRAGAASTWPTRATTASRSSTRMGGRCGSGRWRTASTGGSSARPAWRWTGRATSTRAARSGRVVRYDQAGQPLATWEGFAQPTGLAVDEAGDLYVADRWTGRLAKFRILQPTTR